LTRQKDQARRFYERLWDAHDTGAIPSVLHAALGDYRCVIDELVEESNKVFARMTFTGVHRGEFLGYPPSDRRVSWAGSALFTFDGDLISDIWVLGDLKGLEAQLR
jgi:predicted ester cyclase